MGGGKRLGVIVREAGWRVGGREEIGSHSERGRVESWGEREEIGSHSERGRVESWGEGRDWES